MTRELSLSERRNAIDSRLEAALESARGDYLTPARTVIVERDDRWYGQLVALVYNSAAERPDVPSILRAATAMELFRGYYRLREQLLIQLGRSKSNSITWDSNAALLAADYLHTSAHSTLGSIDDTDVRPCLEILESVSERIVETLADADLESTPSSSAYHSFVDGTAGMLGRGAASIGATLADADDRQRQRFARVGRGFSGRRQLRRSLEAATDAPHPASPVSTDRQCHRYAQEQFADATRALRMLSATADVDSLRTFLERS